MLTRAAAICKSCFFVGENVAHERGLMGDIFGFFFLEGPQSNGNFCNFKAILIMQRHSHKFKISELLVRFGPHQAYTKRHPCLRHETTLDVHVIRQVIQLCITVHVCLSRADRMSFCCCRCMLF